MPCCGITIEYIYARLKAAEVPGSGTADKLLDQLLSVDENPLVDAGEGEEAEISTREKESTHCERIAT